VDVIRAEVTSAPEPVATDRLRAFVASVRARLDAVQAYTIERWSNTVPFEMLVINSLRLGQHDVRSLRRFSLEIGPGEKLVDEKLATIAPALAVAVEKPALASALIWHGIGQASPALASHLVHFVRLGAGLPGLRTRIAADEPSSLTGAYHVGWFSDRQYEDTALWIEAIPVGTANTLGESIAAAERQRAGAARAPLEKIVAFLRLAASYLLLLSSRGFDPLGFKLQRDAQLIVDPPIDQRLSLASWARRSRRAICVRGQLALVRIPIAAPWPFTLELIAAELGRGGCGGFGLMLRLVGEITIAAEALPMMLCLPGEPVEEWGSRFERWTMRAYPHAVDLWRPWC